MTERIIGKFQGQQNGPLLICIGGIHGNEPAGIKAIEEVLTLLEKEVSINPEFQYKGNYIGVRGNLPAIEQQKRFINRDLNRMLTDIENSRIQELPLSERSIEDHETFELIKTIDEEIRNNPSEFILIIDLHTTTADGGIFTISTDDPVSRQLAIGLHAPVILGIAEGLTGTTIEFFNKPERNQYCIVFEAGQHDDLKSIYRSVAAVVSAMKTIGSIDAKDVNVMHEKVLAEQSAGLPKLTRLVYHYKIKPGENFQMLKGFKNFQPVVKGEKLATNNNGDVHAPVDGLILMPKYQSQGDDGFFLVSPVV